jgi:hypothetical protein
MEVTGHSNSGFSGQNAPKGPACQLELSESNLIEPTEKQGAYHTARSVLLILDYDMPMCAYSDNRDIICHIS